MNEFQKAWCLETLNELLANKLSLPFHDSLGSGLTILRPTNADFKSEESCTLTLKKIKENLLRDKYKRMKDFGNDVNEVWRYAFLNFKETSIFYISTKILSDWFRNKFDNRPRTKEEKWLTDAQQLQTDLDAILRQFDRKK